MKTEFFDDPRIKALVKANAVRGKQKPAAKPQGRLAEQFFLFNLNNHIYVRLSEAGERAYWLYWEDFWTRAGQLDYFIENREVYANRIIPNKEGEVRFQAWLFMQIFASSFGSSLGETSLESMNVRLEKS